MFNHVMVGADDLPGAKRFYDALLGELGIGPGVMDTPERCRFSTRSGTFMIKKPINGEAASNGNGSTVGFVAGSPEQAKAAHDAGVANGGVSCEDPPGVRERGGVRIYLAYLRDPTGNKICLAHALK
jgi:catechol 2,3-dioxygenase-like lactoylglutathione lyase family enzyme